jgi:amidohydrolase
MDLLHEVKQLYPIAQSFRRDFHRHPELGFNELRTSRIIKEELEKLGIKTITGVGSTGVIGLLEGNKAQPVLLLRFDMDALPITEENNLEYASQSAGVMHACGHDGHVAIGLTLARLLAEHREQLNGVVKFVFQPAEETLRGARAMVEDGVLQNPPPNFTLGAHLWNEKHLGWIGLVPGPMMAGADIFSIRVKGNGGHGANPHLASDPILAAAHIIIGLQSIVSRNIPPLESAVLSVTKMNGGSSYNIIPPYVDLSGTIRTLKPSIREKTVQRFHQIVGNIAKAFDCDVISEIETLSRPVNNDKGLMAFITDIARNLYPNLIVDSHYRTMISEDVCFFMDEIPGCFLLIGSASHARGLNYPHHHPRFDFDEACLPSAIALLSQCCFSILSDESTLASNPKIK